MNLLHWERLLDLLKDKWYLVFFYWLLANVIPIHKKGDKLHCNSYIPISLLSNISKIYEKCMYTHLKNFLQINNLFFTDQLVFCNDTLRTMLSLV